MDDESFIFFEIKLALFGISLLLSILDNLLNVQLANKVSSDAHDCLQPFIELFLVDGSQGHATVQKNLWDSFEEKALNASNRGLLFKHIREVCQFLPSVAQMAHDYIFQARAYSLYFCQNLSPVMRLSALPLHLKLYFL